MVVVLYIWLFLISFTTLFIIASVFIEKNFNENSKVMKWWRKHIVGVVEKDDNPE